MKKDKLLTTRQAAEVIGCSIKHIQYLARNGYLLIKIEDSDVNQYGRRVWISKAEAIRYRDKPITRGRPRKGA